MYYTVYVIQQNVRENCDLGEKIVREKLGENLISYFFTRKQQIIEKQHYKGCLERKYYCLICQVEIKTSNLSQPCHMNDTI